MKKLSILTVILAIALIVSVVFNVVLATKKNEDVPTTSTPTSSLSSSGSSSSSPAEEEKVLYADDEGNVYKIVAIVKNKNDTEFVICQDIETYGVDIIEKSRFYKLCHIVDR